MFLGAMQLWSGAGLVTYSNFINDWYTNKTDSEILENTKKVRVICKATCWLVKSDSMSFDCLLFIPHCILSMCGHAHENCTCEYSHLFDSFADWDLVRQAPALQRHVHGARIHAPESYKEVQYTAMDSCVDELFC